MNKRLLFFLMVVSLPLAAQVSRRLAGHDWSVTSLVLNTKGDLLLSGSWDKTMRLWDLNTGEVVNVFKGHQEMLWDVAFSHTEKWVASASWDGSIRVYDLQSKNLLHNFQHTPNYKYVQYEPFYTERMMPNMVHCIDFHPNDSLIAGASSDGMIRIWDLHKGELQRVLNFHDSVSVQCVIWNGNGSKLISGSNKILVYDYLLEEVTTIMDGHKGELIGVLTMSPDGQYLVSADLAFHNPLIILWDLKTGEQLKVFRGHKSIVRDVSFSSDGKYLASVGEDNLIILWSVKGDGEPVIFSDKDGKELNAVRFTPGNKQIIYGSQDSQIKFRDVEKCIVF